MSPDEWRISHDGNGIPRSLGGTGGENASDSAEMEEFDPLRQAPVPGKKE
jgi:hypothetical protein